jgi:protein TonB
MANVSKTLQPFDALLDDAREAGRLRHAGEPRTVETRPRREPILTLGRFLADDAAPVVRRRRGIAIPASVLLHAIAAAAVVVVPLLLADSLPTATTGVRAFFVEPITAPPPPPPPPPAARGAAVARPAPKAEVKTAGFTAPVDVPTAIQPEEALDLGVEGGVPGGVEGGVPGGVVGGVVTDLPEAPPPPAPARAVRVGGDIREPRKVVDVAPVYPEVAMKAYLEGIVIIECTIDERGRVREATVLRGVPLLDEAALAAVRRWVYTPTLLDGVPRPVIMTVTVRFQLKAPRR